MYIFLLVIHVQEVALNFITQMLEYVIIVKHLALSVFQHHNVFHVKGNSFLIILVFPYVLMDTLVTHQT